MEDQQNQLAVPIKTRRPWWVKTLYAVIAIIFVLVIAAIMIPTFDGPNMRQHANEAVAVGRLRTISRLENAFTQKSPENAVTCDLRELMPFRQDNERFDDDFFLAGKRSGYTFSIMNCRTAPDGVRRTYQLTAVPNQPGKSGTRAFCSDENGVIWFDLDGSAEECLKKRDPLP